MKRPMQRSVLLATMTTVFLACWPNQQSLEPYPCAADGTCASPAWCVPEIGCIEKSSNFGPCRGGADCSHGDCSSGVCVNRNSCTGTEVGAPVGNPFHVSCFQNCGAGQVCQLGTTCVDLISCSDSSCSSEGSGRGCIGKPAAALLDQACEGAQCGDSVYWCHQKMCVLTCGAGFSCPAGRVCVSDTDTVTGSAQAGCFVDCTTGPACPNGLTCTNVGNAKKACLPAGAKGATRACASVSNTQSCGKNFACGMSGQPCSTVFCTPGKDNSLPDGTCPVNSGENAYEGSTCPANKSCWCQCYGGYTGVNCQTGTACNSNNCTGQAWGCRRTSPPGCTDVTDGFSGTCNCVNGKSVAFQCNGAQTCEQLCGAAQ